MGAIVDYINLKEHDIPLIYEHQTNLPTVSMQIVFKNSGSLAEGEKFGLAKLSAKLLGEGTLKDGPTKFAAKLEDRAIDMHVSCGRETFVFEMSALKSEFSTAITLLKSLIKDPNFSDETLAKIKNQTLSAIASKQSDFDYIASLELNAKLFHKTPLAHPSLGTNESLEKIKLEDIKKFLEAHMILENMVIVIGGDIDKDEAYRESYEIIKNIKAGKSKELKYITTQPENKEFRVYKDTQQAYIYFGSNYNIKVIDEDRYKATVAAFILGSSGFGSRLMEEIRVKRGLAYSAYGRITNNKTHSYFSGYLQTKIENEAEAKKVVIDEIEKFVKKGVTKEELTAAKRFIIGSEPLRNETLSQRLNKTFMEYYKGLKFGASDEDLKKIEALSLDDLNSYIKSHNEILDLTFVVVTAEQK